MLSGNQCLPFTGPTTWLATQAECADLQYTKAHLQQGTSPFKKITNIKNVTHIVTIAKDGLFIVKRDEPLIPRCKCIIASQQVLNGLLTTQHIQLDYPSRYGQGHC